MASSWLGYCPAALVMRYITNYRGCLMANHNVNSRWFQKQVQHTAKSLKTVVLLRGDFFFLRREKKREFKNTLANMT